MAHVAFHVPVVKGLKRIMFAPNRSGNKNLQFPMLFNSFPYSDDPLTPSGCGNNLTTKKGTSDEGKRREEKKEVGEVLSE